MKCDLRLRWHEDDWSNDKHRISGDQIGANKYFESIKNDYRGTKAIHVGTGSSSVFIQFKDIFSQIDGVAVSQREIDIGKELGYKVHFFNKFDVRNWSKLDNDYSIIIDTCPKSYTCCDNHWIEYFECILSKLKKGGKFITHTQGFGDYGSDLDVGPMDFGLTVDELRKFKYHVEEIKELTNEHGNYPVVIYETSFNK